MPAGGQPYPPGQEPPAPEGAPGDAFGVVGDMLEGLRNVVEQQSGNKNAVAIVEQMIVLKDQLMSELGVGGAPAGGAKPAPGGSEMASGNPAAVPVR